LNHVQTMQHR